MEQVLPGSPEARAPQQLSLLSYNIQVGIRTERYHHYITRAWQHVLPSARRAENLTEISGLLSSFDVVALQEADGGSLRSGFINQVEFLARKSGHPYWYQQRNRNFGPFAQHSNGCLCRSQPASVSMHSLPGKIPGRGCIEVIYGHSDNPLTIIVMHLALGKKDQQRQLSYIRELVYDRDNLVLMGDMNAGADYLLQDSPLSDLGLYSPADTRTYPSWKPRRGLDHILVSENIVTRKLEVPDHRVSDHLPVAIHIEWG